MLCFIDTKDEVHDKEFSCSWHTCWSHSSDFLSSKYIRRQELYNKVSFWWTCDQAGRGGTWGEMKLYWFIFLVTIQWACDDLAALISSPRVCGRFGKEPLKCFATVVSWARTMEGTDIEIHSFFHWAITTVLIIDLTNLQILTVIGAAWGQKKQQIFLCLMWFYELCACWERPSPCECTKPKNFVWDTCTCNSSQSSCDFRSGGLPQNDRPPAIQPSSHPALQLSRHTAIPLSYVLSHVLSHHPAILLSYVPSCHLLLWWDDGIVG